MTPNVPAVPDLALLADALAAAIRRRHELDEIAARGESVPAMLMHAAEAEIRAAELAVVRARAG